MISNLILHYVGAIIYIDVSDDNNVNSFCLKFVSDGEFFNLAVD